MKAAAPQLGMVIATAVFGLAGCYSTRALAPEALRAVGAALAEPRLLHTSAGPVVLEPEAQIRAHLRGGGSTAWFQAGALLVGDEGLALRDGVPAARVAKVSVTGLDARELALLDATRPAGGAALPWYEWRRLEVSGGGAGAVDWAMRFATAASGAGAQGGWWRLDSNVGFAEAMFGDGPRQQLELGSEVLRAAASRSAPTFAPGFRWDEIDGLEVRTLDPHRSAMALPLAPLLLVLAALDSSSLDHDRDPYGGSGEGRGLSVQAFQLDARTPPLFTGRARRRAVVKPLVTAGLRGGFQGDFGFGASLGIRLRNLWDFAVLIERHSLTGLSPGRIARPVMGAAMGMHLDADLDPRRAFYFGLEVGGRRGDDAFSFLTLKWGPRFGLGDAFFVTVAPLNLTFVTGDDGRLGRTTRVTAALDVGATW